jgi:hypothetical protein
MGPSMPTPAKIRLELDDCTLVRECTFDELHDMVIETEPSPCQCHTILNELAHDLFAEGVAPLELDGRPFMRAVLVSRTRKEAILARAADLAGAFLYYDRKEDSEIPVGEIEAALENGEITVDEIFAAFLRSAGQNVAQFKRAPAKLPGSMAACREVVERCEGVVQRATEGVDETQAFDLPVMVKAGDLAALLVIAHLALRESETGGGLAY